MIVKYSQIYYFLLLLTLVLVIGLNLIIFRYIYTYNRDIKKQRKKISLHISCTIRKRQCYVYPFRRKPRGKKKNRKVDEILESGLHGTIFCCKLFLHPLRRQIDTGSTYPIAYHLSRYSRHSRHPPDCLHFSICDHLSIILLCVYLYIH